MDRLTYYEGGRARIKIGNTEYSGQWVDRYAAYEDTGLEPEEIINRDEIELNAAICISEYAKDKQPIEAALTHEDRAYRMGWEDACQYIREQFECLTREGAEAALGGDAR